MSAPIVDVGTAAQDDAKHKFTFKLVLSGTVHLPRVLFRLAHRELRERANAMRPLCDFLIVRQCCIRILFAHPSTHRITWTLN